MRRCYMRRPRANCQKWESGFTVLEMVIVLGAVSLLLTILTLGVRQAIGSFALRRAAAITSVELRRAQAAAIAAGSGSAYTVEFVGTGGLRVYVQTSGTPVKTVAPPDEWPTSVSINLAATTFPACVSPASPSNKCVTFQPLGYASKGGAVVLMGGVGTAVTYYVNVAPATGRVSITQQ
jgi:type II secretory pathway pseudopilin PulG